MTRTVEVHAELHPTKTTSGHPQWLAAVAEGRRRGMFAFGDTATAACEALAELVSSTPSARHPERPPRAARVWVNTAYDHESIDPTQRLTLPAVVVRSPLGEWLATVRPDAGYPSDTVAYGETAATAIEDLALLVADAYADGSVPGAPAQPTSVRLVVARPATGKVRPTTSGDADA